MLVSESVFAPDGSLSVTLVTFDPVNGKGQIRIEELTTEKGRYYITVKYGDAGQTRIDYKTYDYDVYKSKDVHKSKEQVRRFQ
jgi:hypothetical protein